MDTKRKFQVYPMDDDAAITDDFFDMPLIDGSEGYSYDEKDLAESMEKARLAREFCRKFRKDSLQSVQ